MLHVGENSHLNVFLLSSPNRFDFTFLAIWFVEQKYGSTVTLYMLLTGLSRGCGLFLFTKLDSNPDFTPKQAIWVLWQGSCSFLRRTVEPSIITSCDEHLSHFFHSTCSILPCYASPQHLSRVY